MEEIEKILDKQLTELKEIKVFRMAGDRFLKEI